MTTIKFITDNGQQIAVSFENISGLVHIEDKPFKLTNSMLEQIASYQSNDDANLDSDLNNIANAVVILGQQLVSAAESEKPEIIGSVLNLSITHAFLKRLKSTTPILY